MRTTESLRKRVIESIQEEKDALITFLDKEGEAGHPNKEVSLAIAIRLQELDQQMNSVISSSQKKEINEKNNWKREIAKVKQCPKREDSTLDQLIDLYSVTTKLGFYDAGDFLYKLIVKRIPA